MRLGRGPLNEQYARFLGDMSYKPELQGSIELPSYIQRSEDTRKLVEAVFPTATLSTGTVSDIFLAERAILAIRNDCLPEFNRMLLDHLPGPESQCYAVDQALSEDHTTPNHTFSPEYLRTINLAGLPPSALELKVGAPIMLLRNLRYKDGLCNGTRMVVTKVRSLVIKARILTRTHKGTIHLIPRIILYSNADDLPFILSQRQFPVRVCFVMTVNKS